MASDKKRKPRKPLKRKTELKKKDRPGTAFNSTLRPGPWNRDGKISKQVRKTLSTDRMRSLWIRTVNASWHFVRRSPGGSFPKGAEGLRWGLCNLEGCNKPGQEADHIKGRGGATSPSKTNPYWLGVLCTKHNTYDKGSQHWADYRPKEFRYLVVKLARLHFDEDTLKPGKFEINSRGRSWIRDMYGSL